MPLAHIINLCFKKGIFPDELKIAIVVPIHKNGEKYNINNYRPISMLNSLSKVFEKIIANRIMNFFMKHELLSDKQFGFMKKIGTTDAIARLSEYLHNGLDKSKPIIATYIDLSKAFDCVNHKLLLNKLENYGIRGVPLELIKNYFTDRVQLVKLGDTYSLRKAINIGVPQGSILGPLFFIIFINDLLQVIDNISAYADDTVIYASKITWSETEKEINNNLITLNSWFYKNKLLLNKQKTTYVAFANRKKSIPASISINIDNEIIQKSSHAKYLGIVFDEQLKWKEHVKTIYSKLRYLPYVFSRLKPIVEYPKLVAVYHALFNSLASYGIVAWGGAYEIAIKMLNKLQDKIIKIVNCNIEGNEKRELLNIRQIYVYRSLLITHDRLRLEYMGSDSITRNKEISLPKYELEVGKQNHKYTAVKFFNKLPKEIKLSAIKQKSTQIKLRKWIFENI